MSGGGCQRQKLGPVAAAAAEAKPDACLREGPAQARGRRAKKAPQRHLLSRHEGPLGFVASDKGCLATALVARREGVPQEGVRAVWGRHRDVEIAEATPRFSFGDDARRLLLSRFFNKPAAIMARLRARTLGALRTSMPFGRRSSSGSAAASSSQSGASSCSVVERRTSNSRSRATFALLFSPAAIWPVKLLMSDARVAASDSGNKASQCSSSASTSSSSGSRSGEERAPPSQAGGRRDRGLGWRQAA